MVGSRWMLYSPPSKTKLEFQWKYRASNMNDQLKTSWREVLQIRIYRISYIETGRKGRDVKRAGLLPWAPAEMLKGYSCKDSSWGAWSLDPMPGSPAQSTRAGKRQPHNTRLWKAVWVLSAMERWESARYTCPVKGPVHNISFSVAHPGLQQREGSVN